MTILLHKHSTRYFLMMIFTKVFVIHCFFWFCFCINNVKAAPVITWDFKEGSSNFSFLHEKLTILFPSNNESSHVHLEKILSDEKSKDYQEYTKTLEYIVQNNWITEWDDYKNEYRSNYGTACENDRPAAFCQEITFSIANFYAKNCLWSVDGKAPVSALCKKFSANIPIDKNIIIRVHPIDRPADTIETTVHVKGKVIIALGDSFASGEGNPDRPAKHDDNISKIGSGYNFYLSRGKNWQSSLQSGPLWLDRTCHRSMLSHQFLVALRYAAENPKQRVVFASFSCSGAEIVRGLLQPQLSLPYKNTSEKLPLSQIDSAVNFLCSDTREESKGENDFRIVCNDPDNPTKFRKPDLILLSIGGNDAGFGPLIANTFSPKLPLPLFLFLPVKLTFPYFDIFQGSMQLAGKYKTPDQAEEIIKNKLEGLYKKLNEELKERFLVDHHQPGIIQTNYPDLLKSCDQDWNRMGNLGLQIIDKDLENLGTRLTRPFRDYEWFFPPFVEEWFNTMDLSISEREAKKLREKVITKLQEAVIANEKYKWKIAEIDEKVIKEHDLCSLDEVGKTKTDDSEKIFKTFRVPYRDHEGAKTEWLNDFKPSEWSKNPYSFKRQRWFNTIDDSIMKLATRICPEHWQNGKDVCNEMLMGAMHPTLAYHATLADVIYSTAKDILEK